MRYRTLVTFAVSASLLAGSAAITVAQSEPLPQIRVAVWSGPEADNLRKVVEAYTAETGNPVEIDEIARDGYDAALRTSIVGAAPAHPAANGRGQAHPSGRRRLRRGDLHGEVGE